MTFDDITRLKVLAGITEATTDELSKDGTKVDGDDESNVSVTGSEKSKYMRDNDIEPGTAEWFKLWFSQPLLTGENPMPKRNKK